jgi:hypothetical protein
VKRIINETRIVTSTCEDIVMKTIAMSATLKKKKVKMENILSSTLPEEEKLVTYYVCSFCK